jgi:hypothetical protein
MKHYDLIASVNNDETLDFGKGQFLLKETWEKRYSSEINRKLELHNLADVTNSIKDNSRSPVMHAHPIKGGLSMVPSISATTKNEKQYIAYIWADSVDHHYKLSIQETTEGSGTPEYPSNITPKAVDSKKPLLG